MSKGIEQDVSRYRRDSVEEVEEELKDASEEHRWSGGGETSRLLAVVAEGSTEAGATELETAPHASSGSRSQEKDAVEGNSTRSSRLAENPN